MVACSTGNEPTDVHAGVGGLWSAGRKSLLTLSIRGGGGGSKDELAITVLVEHQSMSFEGTKYELLLRAIR